MNADAKACVEDVRRTLAYLTAVGHGGTLMDVWRWLYRPTRNWTLCDVDEALHTGVQSGLFEEHEARYVLFGHAHVLRDGHERALWSDVKFRSVRWFLRYLRLVPGVRAVAVCNSLAFEMAARTSDIDLFVITRTRAMWLVRFFALLPLRMLRRRPGYQTEHPICLSFFVTERGLNFDRVRLEPEDPHMAHWLLSMIPMIDDGAFAEFITANEWARELFPNAELPQMAWYRRLPQSRPWRWQPPACVDVWLERAQRRRLPPRIAETMNRTTDVIVNEHMLKFHTNDRRAEYRARFESLLKTTETSAKV